MMYSKERKDWIFTEVVAKGEEKMEAKSDVLTDLYSALDKK
jgi:hypothetical protein